MKKAEKRLIKWLAGGAIATGLAGLADFAAADIIFKEAFTRKDPNKKSILGMQGGDGQSNYFEKYRVYRDEGKQWLKEKEPISEYWTVFSFDMKKLRARFIPTQPMSKKTVICVHGYHSTGEDEYVLMGRMFYDAGYNILLIDHRTHGASGGDYIGFGCLEKADVRRWVREVDKRFDGRCEIYLHGVSMGAASVLMASGLEMPSALKGIVADCGYTTPKAILEAVVDQGLVKVPFSGAVIAALNEICKYKAGFRLESASSLESVAKAKCPIFIIHGSKDMLVPVSMAHEIYDACTGPKKLWIVEGANHAESSCLRPEEYKNRVIEFLEACGAE